MYASSSRILVKTSFKVSSRSFSTTTPSLARRETFVELLQDVPGLGRTFDRLFVAPGRARNDLVPTRKARFVPFKDNNQRQIYRATEADRKSSSLLIESSSFTPSSSSLAEESTTTPQDLLNILHLVPSPLTFKRRTISPDYPSLHGSLTLSDIQERLENQYGLSSKDVQVSWVGRQDGSRMKELDTWDAIISLRKGGKESTDVKVEVVRLGEGEGEED
ncbi:hypothetical protein I302_102967 [Kwoniella bestiolae CBS 10118]|uniref:Ribosomal protein L9 domain-containing protein n=1 Tax=Kwoniella bestiolae CBS 10118 TaxID=1296100 RepID=A0A1B9GGG3_9TREE|nr:hypothetical protein I302_01663 [Kwoniella bestiolae CBS 10118]OCF30144.1 hypothetical protein I302_01663 [Kwoniella bestiolae CBS 10118]